MCWTHNGMTLTLIAHCFFCACMSQHCTGSCWHSASRQSRPRPRSSTSGRRFRPEVSVAAPFLPRTSVGTLERVKSQRAFAVSEEHRFGPVSAHSRFRFSFVPRSVAEKGVEGCKDLMEAFAACVKSAVEGTSWGILPSPTSNVRMWKKMFLYSLFHV